MWQLVVRPRFDSQQARNCSLLHSVQTCCGNHPVSYPVHAEVTFPLSKEAGVKQTILLSDAEVNSDEARYPLPSPQLIN
jgi:hypothetical protein